MPRSKSRSPSTTTCRPEWVCDMHVHKSAATKGARKRKSGGESKQERRAAQARNGVVVTQLFDPAAWRTGLILADGNTRRLHPVAGAVYVTNSERRPEWLDNDNS